MNSNSSNNNMNDAVHQLVSSLESLSKVVKVDIGNNALNDLGAMLKHALGNDLPNREELRAQVEEKDKRRKLSPFYCFYMDRENELSRDTIPKERLKILLKQWNILTKEEKKDYHDKMLANHEDYLNRMHNHYFYDNSKKDEKTKHQAKDSNNNSADTHPLESVLNQKRKSVKSQEQQQVLNKINGLKDHLVDSDDDDDSSVPSSSSSDNDQQSDSSDGSSSEDEDVNIKNDKLYTVFGSIISKDKSKHSVDSAHDNDSSVYGDSDLDDSSSDQGTSTNEDSSDDGPVDLPEILSGESSSDDESKASDQDISMHSAEEEDQASDSEVSLSDSQNDDPEEAASATTITRNRQTSRQISSSSSSASSSSSETDSNFQGEELDEEDSDSDEEGGEREVVDVGVFDSESDQEEAQEPNGDVEETNYRNSLSSSDESNDTDNDSVSEISENNDDSALSRPAPNTSSLSSLLPSSSRANNSYYNSDSDIEEASDSDTSVISLTASSTATNTPSQKRKQQDDDDDLSRHFNKKRRYSKYEVDEVKQEAEFDRMERLLLNTS